MSEDSYVVTEKLDKNAYRIKTDPYRLKEQAQKAGDAGIKSQFYAYIPRIERRDESKLIREHGLYDEKKQTQPVPPEFMRKMFEIDGICLLSNMHSSDGKLKLVEPIPENVMGGSAAKIWEIDDDWEVFIDPVTAAFLGIESNDGPQATPKRPSTPSDDILVEINNVRKRLRLTQEEIVYRIRQNKEQARIR
ncbi:MAG: hypothetical protein M1287_00670 [Firmicutes bacterium]|nr:hypothetical protein [Bacillota bacterium]